MARWQLQCSGKSEEAACKFCDAPLPDWREALFKDIAYSDQSDTATLVLESGELIVTKRGKAIARVLPIKGRKNRPDHADLRGCMPRLNEPSEALIAAERDER